MFKAVSDHYVAYTRAQMLRTSAAWRNLEFRMEKVVIDNYCLEDSVVFAEQVLCAKLDQARYKFLLKKWNFMLSTCWV